MLVSVAGLIRNVLSLTRSADHFVVYSVCKVARAVIALLLLIIPLYSVVYCRSQHGARGTWTKNI